MDVGGDDDVVAFDYAELPKQGSFGFVLRQASLDGHGALVSNLEFEIVRPDVAATIGPSRYEIFKVNTIDISRERFNKVRKNDG